MYETIVRYCVSICQKGLVTVVFTAEKKRRKCVLMFYNLLVDCLMIQSGSAGWGGVDEMCHQFNPYSIW